MALQLVEDHLAVGAVGSTDLECIGYLRQLRQRECEPANAALPSEVVNALLTSLHPAMLQPCFVLVGSGLVPPMTTPHGRWRKTKHVAVRMTSSSCNRSRYIGVKKTLEFVPHTHAGNKRLRGGDCWTMIQYQSLRRKDQRLKLVIEENMTLCKVLNQKDEDTYPSAEKLEDLEKWLNSSQPEEQLAPSEELRLTEWSQDLENVLMKQGPEHHPEHHAIGESVVWKYFSKIHREDLQLTCAACHACDGVLMAGSKRNGTSTLGRHPCTAKSIQAQACSSSTSQQTL